MGLGLANPNPNPDPKQGAQRVRARAVVSTAPAHALGDTLTPVLPEAPRIFGKVSAPGPARAPPGARRCRPAPGPGTWPCPLPTAHCLLSTDP